MISEVNLKKFIDIYEQKYSIKLENQEAFELFSGMVNLVEIAYLTKRINKNS